MSLKTKIHDKIQWYTFSSVQKDKILKKITSILESEPKLVFAYVFGSFLYREFIRDLDLMIFYLPKLKFRDYLSIGTKIEKNIKIPIDLVQFQDLSYSLKMNILTKGNPLIIRNQEIISQQKVLALIERNELLFYQKEVM